MNETPKNCPGLTVLTIGESPSNEKRVTLPLNLSPLYLVVGSNSVNPINERHPRWNDTFDAVVDGNTLIVTRTDKSKGWGMNLQIWIWSDPS